MENQIAILHAILDELKEIKNDVSSLKSDVSNLGAKIYKLESDVNVLKSDLNTLKFEIEYIKDVQAEYLHTVQSISNKSTKLNLSNYNNNLTEIYNILKNHSYKIDKLESLF